MEPALASQRVLVGEEVAGSAVRVSLFTQLHQTPELSRPPVPTMSHPSPPALFSDREGQGAGPGAVPSLCRGPMPPPPSQCGRRSGGRGAGAGLQAWVR